MRYTYLLLVAVVALGTLGCAPRTFMRQAPGWKAIELHEGLRGDYDAAWQKTVDTITKSWDIEMLDKDSGYIRTAWLHGISGGDYVRYRGRLTVKYPEIQDPRMLEVRTQAQWLENPGRGVWITGVDTMYERDVYTALAGRLGRTVPSER